MEMNLVRTRFESLDESGDVYSVTYGVRLYDDLVCAYVNTITSLDELLVMDAEDLLEFALRFGNRKCDAVWHRGRGLYSVLCRRRDLRRRLMWRK